MLNIVTKCIAFMRFTSISINLLKIFRIISFVFDLKYITQNSINFNMLGVFWNPPVPEFVFRATFEGDIEVLLLQVLFATTV